MANKQYDNNGQVALWNATSTSGLDYFKGSVEINGKQYNIALFKQDGAEGTNKPVLKGKIDEKK